MAGDGVIGRRMAVLQQAGPLQCRDPRMGELSGAKANCNHLVGQAAHTSAVTCIK